MATKINNARVDWNGYEFAIRFHDGTIEVRGDYDHAKRGATIWGGQVIFRAHYVTEWMEAIENPVPGH